jgi:hypothetical protein
LLQPFDFNIERLFPYGYELCQHHAATFLELFLR